MKEYIFTELGFFSPMTCEKIKKAMDGRTFMNFKVEYSNCAGNCTLYEEAFISDYETDINGLSISEYASIDDLNELAEELENFDECELEAFGAMLDFGYATDEALQKVQDNEYRLYDGCYSMAEVAEMYADETGLLESVPDDLRMYFDFEAYGRDMDINGKFIETDSGYIEIYK